MIPPLTNEFVMLIKETSLVAILRLTLSQQEFVTWLEKRMRSGLTGIRA